MSSLSEQSRIAIIAIVAWTLAVGISYLWNIRVLDNQIVELANAEAESNLKRDLSLRLWSTDHGGIYLRVNKDTKPSPFLAHVPERDIITPDGGMLTLQNPAATLREIKKKHAELYGELARITATQYLNPNNAPDEWEVKALGIVEKSREDYSELTTINGMPYLRRMQPMWMEEGCMGCHAWTGIEIGELRGATDIAIPLNKYQAVTHQQKTVVSGIHSSILLIGLIVIGFITNRSKTRLEERKQTETIVKRSEIKFRTLFDTSADAILMLNEKGFFDCNQAALEMFGLQSQDELRHYRPVDLSPATQACGTDSETLAKHYIDSAMQNGTAHFEWVHKRADSEITFLADIVLTSLMLDGKLVLQATVRDITERRQAEERLSHSEQQLRLSQSYGGIGTWEADFIMNTEVWSEAVTQQLGFPDLAEPTWDDFVATIYPDDREHVLNEIDLHLSEGKALDVEYRIIDPQDKIRWMRSIGKAHFDLAGNPTSMQGTVQEITQQKQAEYDLRIAATAFESQEGMMVTDADRILIRVNKAFTTITGYTKDEAIGNNPRMLSSGRHDAIFYEEMWQEINTTDYWAGEVWNKRKGGEIYPEQLTITAVKNTAGIVTNYVGTLSDITLGKKAEHEIEDLAYYDPLTHLPNRRLMIDRIKHSMAASARSGSEGALLFLDLDHFKDLNDT